MTFRHALVISLLLGAVSAAPGRARAESHKDTTYPYQQVWPAAVRFLRIDEGLKIVERDPDAGYVLFDLTEEKRTFRGALEVVKLKDSDGRPSVRLILRIADRPSYMEMGILNRMLQKMRTELGPAPDPPAPPPPPAPPKKKKPDSPAKPAD